MINRSTAIIAGVLTIAALVSLRFTLGSSGSPVSRELHRSLGLVLAQETAISIHNQGRVVAVIPDAFNQSSPLEWKTFVEELEARAAIKLTSDNGTLDEVLSRQPQTDVIVFFVGAPTLEELQTLTDRQAKPKMIIMLGYPDLPAKAYYTSFFTTGLLSTLILPRGVAEINQAIRAKTQREWFDKYQQIYNQQNYETLPEKTRFSSWRVAATICGPALCASLLVGAGQVS